MSTMPLLDNFLINLRDAMTQQGVNSMQLSKQSGVHYVTISRILNGHLNPSVDICERLAKGVGLRPDTVFLEPLEKSG